jgi:hypothetical protein
VALWACSEGSGGPAGDWQWYGSGVLPVLLVYRDMEKTSMCLWFRVPKFQLSLVLYLSQVCLQ